jgi:DNA-binding transcriptional MerR regulator
MQRDVRYSIDELAALTGTTARLVRHYVQERLLPNAENPGRGAFYGRQHLDALKAIQILKFERRSKLHEIAPILTDRERVRALAQRFDEVHTSHSRSLPADLAGFAEATLKRLRNQGARGGMGVQPEEPMFLNRDHDTWARRSPGEAIDVEPDSPLSPPPHLLRKIEAWNRVSISDGVELHVRMSGGLNEEALERAIKAFRSELLREF